MFSVHVHYTTLGVIRLRAHADVNFLTDFLNFLRDPLFDGRCRRLGHTR